MRIEVYRAKNWDDVPSGAYVTFDGIDTRYYNAFGEYPGSDKYVVIAWGTTGEVDGVPLAVLIATTDHIITGYIDTDFDEEIPPEDMIDDDGETYEPIDHDEPPPKERRAALLNRLRKVSRATWLLVHDADEIDGWTAHRFRVLEPPADVPTDEAVVVLAWGDLPGDASALLQARGLSWSYRYEE